MRSYLTHELLSRLDAATLRFLVRVSVADQVAPGLAAALTGTSADDAGARLREVARTSGFAVELDGPGDWYRLHPLVAELLRERGAPTTWPA